MSPKNPKTFLIKTLSFAASLIVGSFGQDICRTGGKYGLPIFTPADTGISKLRTSYNPGTLQGYFSAGKSFMNSVQSKNFGKYFKGFVSGNDREKEKVKDFEIPIIVVAAFGLMFALLMPCVGCCVYRRKKTIRSRHFHQKRCAIMSCLLFFVILFMFVMNICMFTTNERVHNAAKELGPMANTVINEAVTYSKAILADIKSIMTKQIPCITKIVLDELGSTRLAEGIQELVHTILSNLIQKGMQLADNLQDIAKYLSEIVHKTNRLISMEETLRQQIDLITRNLQNVTAKCDINAIGKTRIQGTCDKLRNVVITTSVDYKSLPNVTKESNNTEAILKKDLAKQMNKTNSVITNMPDTVYRQTRKEKRNINSSIQNMEVVITKELQNVAGNVENEKTFKTNHL